MALTAGPLPDEARHEVEDVLSAEQLALFDSQPAAGTQHGYRVMATLMAAGHDQHDLLVAALLHDVSKYRDRYTWFDRVKVVLGQRFTPGLAAEWAKGPASGWRRAFVVKVAHAGWGAEALAAAGGSELSVALVRRHQEAPLKSTGNEREDRLLALLQWADDQN